MQHHGILALQGHQGCPSAHHGEGRFGRMFPELAPAYLDPALLHALGKPEGPMADMAPEVSTSVTLGFVFLGQFIDHDITLDVTSSLDRRNEALTTRNFRTPTLDLDCVYGAGPEASPFLYDGTAAGALKDRVLNIGFEGLDLPRFGGKALIGDPRNDENRIVSQLQLAFLKYHNAVVEHIEGSVPEHALFEEARRLVRWHYQWIVLHDFLPRMIGRELTDDILCFGPKHYQCGSAPSIPVEFSVAAYRFGHSMVTNRLDLNDVHQDVELFGPETGEGFTPVEDGSQTVKWPLFFDTATPGVSVQFASALDAKLAPELLELPFVGAGDERSLATRNLLRGQSFGLPSGQAIAEAMGIPTLTPAEVGLDKPMDRCTPLWYYVLKEAEVRASGKHLGALGGRIVGEVLIGLMQADETAMLHENPGWQPTLPRHLTGDPVGPYTMADFLHFAGVV